MIPLIAVGDLMLGDSSICVGFGFRSRWPGARLETALEHLVPLFREAEAVIANLECPLTAAGIGRTRLAREQMRGDPEYAAILRRAGVRAVGIANNHAVQHGPEGFAETRRHLEGAGIACVGLRGEDGWCSQPVVLPIAGGRTIGILGYCWRPRQYRLEDPPFAEGSPEAVLADLLRLRPRVDHLVLSLHWGEEFVGQPSAGEVTFARSATGAGADLVIGHHPHVVRPVERFGRSVIAYSLGNAAADMVWQDVLRRGTLLRCRFEEGGVQASACPLYLGDDFRPRPTGPCRPVDDVPVEGLAEEAYRDRIRETIHAQRVAAYRYAARHLTRYPVRVGLELAATTAANKLSGLLPRRHG